MSTIDVSKLSTPVLVAMFVSVPLDFQDDDAHDPNHLNNAVEAESPLQTPSLMQNYPLCSI